MNIVFFGSSQFAVSSLQSLISSGHKVSCVVTQPDKPKGRHLYLSGTLVKDAALKFGIEVYQPESVNTLESIKFLKELKADLFVVISYGQILSEEILNIPKIFCINAHASLLPKYRGASPINRAIINAEKDTGVTIIKMTGQMDAGPIILQQPIEISEDDTDISLEEKLSRIASQLILEMFNSIKDNNFKLTPQDENRVSFAQKLKKEEGLINWEKPALDVYNLIRAITRWPGAFTYYNGKLLKVYKTKVCRPAGPPVSRSAGEIIKVSKEGIVVVTGKDNLVIEELQLEGKRRMRIEEFMSGHKINIGEKFIRKN